MHAAVSLLDSCFIICGSPRLGRPVTHSACVLFLEAGPQLQQGQPTRRWAGGNMLSSAKAAGMRSYPKVATRALREVLSRDVAGGRRALNSTSLSFRCPASTSNQVVASGAVAAVSSTPPALPASVSRHGRQGYGGGEADGLLRGWGGMCAAAVAAAAALAGGGDIENKQVRG